MKLRKVHHERRSSLLYSPKYWLLLTSFCLLAASIVVYIGRQQFAWVPAIKQKDERTADSATQKTEVPTQRNALDFHMTDFEHGWIRYSDGLMKTEDGGAHWQEAKADQLNEAQRNEVELSEAQVNKAQSNEIPSKDVQSKEPELNKAQPNEGLSNEAQPQEKQPNGLASGKETSVDAMTAGLLDLGERQQFSNLTFESKTYAIKQTQFLTDRIGWALVVVTEELRTPLFVTVDGGQTWSDEVTPAIRGVMLAEKERLQQLKKEAAMYADADKAKAAIHSEWTLMPAASAPGDVVLVRHNKPGAVAWLGKTYTLQPFGAGYFTYLPITMQAKPGAYPIGDQTLTIQAKKFETQYLKVSEQMESMRQDTGRIQADQKKIDLARSKSEPEFLFSGPFIQPIEGILTTPYGYTRYVNGKYDSSHLAIDLAAKEGTPIKATNDGVVALADSLYLTGNSIYIDHGMGLYSQYAHLSELRVKTGDRVKQGDIIGLVGTTGFSTGPHLHFTFWAHNVQVNPNLFFNTTPFQWVK